MLILISYDLIQPSRNYQALYDAIKKAPAWCHAMESMWFVYTKESVNLWTKRLRQAIDENDSLFVVDITNKSRSGWLSKDFWKWLDQHDR